MFERKSIKIKRLINQLIFLKEMFSIVTKTQIFQQKTNRLGTPMENN